MVTEFRNENPNVRKYIRICGCAGGLLKKGNLLLSVDQSFGLRLQLINHFFFESLKIVLMSHMKSAI